MSPPLISIVTPSLDQARFVEENILSVLAQHYPRVEHVVIDGGSTDGTIEILKRYNHLRWISEPDRGQSHALNKGFAMATGEIIGWLNADDTYCTNAFHHIVEEFEKSDAMVVCGDGFEIDAYGKVLRPLSSRNASPEQLIRYWKWQYEFVQPAFFYRSRVFDEVGYLDESLHYAMDVDFLIRLGKRYEFRHVVQPIANLRLHEGSKTGKTISQLVPVYIREMHRVSVRHWGRPTQPRYYRYASSFVGALVLSFLKNVFFVKGSKARIGTRRLFKRSHQSISPQT